MVLPPRLDPGCLMLPCLAKSQLWPQFNFFSASPREPDKSEFGTNPGRQKRGRKSNLMKQRRFFWYKWYKNWFKCIFKNQIRLSTVDNFRAKTSLFPTYQDLAGTFLKTTSLLDDAAMSSRRASSPARVTSGAHRRVLALDADIIGRCAPA